MSIAPFQSLAPDQEALAAHKVDMPEMDEATRRGLALYETRLKAILEPKYNGQVVAIHPDTEDYLVAQTSGEAMRAMHRRQPEGQVLLHVIGPVSADSGLAARVLGTRMLAR